MGLRRKHDPKLMAELTEFLKVDVTGKLSSGGIYMSPVVNVCWKGHSIPVPYSHMVWFAAYGKWPQEGYHLDHINNDPFDNRIENLEEITAKENQKKRRGRKVYRSYGRGKYGDGFTITHGKRDKTYSIRHSQSRGTGIGDLKTHKKCFGAFRTLELAETRVEELKIKLKNGELQ